MTLFIMAYLFAFAMVYVLEILTEKLCHKFSYAASSSQSFIAPILTTDLTCGISAAKRHAIN